MLSIPSRYIAAVFLCSVPASLAGETPPAFSRLPHTSTWLGNSHGRADGKWVQNNVLGIHVGAGGTLFTNSWWDEGRRESGIYSGADGDPIGMLESLHDSFGGGFAITGDDRFIYSSNWDTVRQTPSLPGTDPHSDRPRCGGRESKFLAVKANS